MGLYRFLPPRRRRRRQPIEWLALFAFSFMSLLLGYIALRVQLLAPLYLFLLFVLLSVGAAMTGALFGFPDRRSHVAIRIGGAMGITLALLGGFQHFIKKDYAKELVRMTDSSRTMTYEMIRPLAPPTLVYMVKVFEDVERAVAIANAFKFDAHRICPKMKLAQQLPCFRNWVSKVHHSDHFSMPGILLLAAVDVVSVNRMTSFLTPKTPKELKKEWVDYATLELIDGTILNLERLRRGQFADAAEILGRRPSEGLSMAKAVDQFKRAHFYESDALVVELVEKEVRDRFLLNLRGNGKTDPSPLKKLFAEVATRERDFKPANANRFEKRKVWLRGFLEWTRVATATRAPASATRIDAGL